MRKTKKNNKFIGITDAAKILGLSRMHIIRKIKKGEIPAERVGKIFLIPTNELSPIFRSVNSKEARQVNSYIDRVLKEYGETLKLLGKD